MNKVILIGNLGADPEVRHTQGGEAVANLRLATSERWKDKAGQQQERTEWHRIVFFGRRAEVLAEYTRKGSKLLVEGQIQTRKWTDNEGNDRYTTEIRGANFEFLDSASSAPSAPSAGPSAPMNQPVEDDEIPF